MTILEENIPISDEEKDFIINILKIKKDENNNSSTMNIIENKIDKLNNYKIIEVDTFYDEINYSNELINKEIENDERLKKMKWNDAYNELCDIYNFRYLHNKKHNEKLHDINIASRLGYIDLARNSTINVFEQLLEDFEINYDYISLKDNDKIYVCYNKEKEMENVTILDNNNDYKISPFLQYKINKLKNKLKNKNLNKDLTFKINGKEYKFSSNKINEPVINIKKDKKIYTKSSYYEKYKTKINVDDIKKQEEIIKNNVIENKNFWDNYNEIKNKSKERINKIFENDPIIEFDRENFYKQYEGKHYIHIYKNIILELDELEKEYNNYKIIETYYNKLKDDININTIFKNQNNKINKLFTEYENNRVNEYRVLQEIGNLFVNNKLTKNEVKEINSMNQNSRPARLIKQSKRVFLLEEFVNIKNIALAGISNWLRDTSDDNFNILLSFFNINSNNIPDDEYFSDDDAMKFSISMLKRQGINKLVFT